MFNHPKKKEMGTELQNLKRKLADSYSGISEESDAFKMWKEATNQTNSTEKKKNTILPKAKHPLDITASDILKELNHNLENIWSETILNLKKR